MSLKYAYDAPVLIARYPLLGSLVRAIGKGWGVRVLGKKEEQGIFKAVQSLLRDELKLILQFEKVLDAKIDVKTHELTLSTFSTQFENQQIINEYITNSLDHFMSIEQNPKETKYDLISLFTQDRLSKKGVIAVTGNGKGKTTTALGIALESVATGGKTAVVQWFKERHSGDLTWAINEHFFPEQLKDPDLFQFYPTGSGFVGSPNMDRVKEESKHKRKAKEGVALAKKLIASKEYSVIVLDELVDTLPQVMEYLPYQLLELREVQELLQLATGTETTVVVTGRKVTAEWHEYIKESIVITEVKHPWSSKKQGAISGLDF